MACSTIFSTCRFRAFPPPYPRIGRFVDLSARSLYLSFATPAMLRCHLHTLFNHAEKTITLRLRCSTECRQASRINRIIAGEYPIPIYLNRYLILVEVFEIYSYRTSTMQRHVSECLVFTFRGYHERRGEAILNGSWKLSGGCNLHLHVPGRPGSYSSFHFFYQVPDIQEGPDWRPSEGLHARPP